MLAYTYKHAIVYTITSFLLIEGGGGAFNRFLIILFALFIGPKTRIA